MARSRIAIRIVLTGLLLLPLRAQSPIRGPMLGWVWDARKENIRPILGIAGSSMLGKAPDLGYPIKFAAISGTPEQALVLRGDDRQLALLDLRGAQPVTRSLDLPGGAERIILSPRGEAALLWYPEPRRLLAVAHLAAEPAVTLQYVFPASEAPSVLAINDTGTLAVASVSGSRQIQLIDSSGNARSLPPESELRAAAFLERSDSILLSTETGVRLVSEPGGAAQSRTVWEGSSAGAVLAAGPARALLVDTSALAIVELNFDTGESRTVSCPCSPTNVARLANAAVFRLNEVSDGPLWLVEISETGLRTVFVPPDNDEPPSPE